MTSILKKTGEVSRLIQNAKIQAASLHSKYRVLAVTTLWHAAMHGDASLLNSFYGSISENHQAGLKRWIVKEILTSCNLTNVSDAWVTFSTKELFKVKKDRQESRDLTMMHLEEHQDETEFGAFWKIDTDKVSNPFNNTKLLEQLHNLLKKAEKGADAGEIDRSLLIAMETAVETVDREAKRIVARSEKAPVINRPVNPDAPTFAGTIQ